MSVSRVTRRGKKMLSLLLVNILGFVIVLNIIMFFLQPGMIFIPYQTLDQSPRDWGLEYEDVFIHTSDAIKLHGWYIPHKDSKRTLLFFHGNAGNISHRGESIKIFHRLGFNVLIFDYRGYGKSEGQPSETGLYEDAHSAWNYLLSKKELQPDNIIIFGRSLGGAVAVKLATEVQPDALILESVFSSAADMAKSLYPGLYHLLVLRFDFDNKAMIKQVHSPLLLMHSPDDEIIPFKQGKKVFLAANQPKKMIILQGNHNNGFLQSQPDYEHHLKRFILSLDSKSQTAMLMTGI
jgi:fermentation-respiration switch protein FrsA (DUF1100 family)